MFYEKQDGAAWRTDENAARLLERKMAISLAANGAGFIEWIWNINPYMDNENEAAIGFHRFDGTAKKELKSFIKIAKFANENRQYFKGKVDEKTLLVIPHSYQFLPRNYVNEATKKAVRVLHYHCLQTVRAVSEYNLQAILREPIPPKLIVVPSVNSFNQEAWKNLLKLVEKGSTLAISGYFDDDEYLISQNRLKDFGLNGNYSPVPVSPNELFEGFYTHFGGEKIQQVRKADVEQSDKIKNFLYKGKNVFWSPVPLEIGDSLQAIKKFYDLSLAKAGLLPEFELDDYLQGTILVRPTEFEKAILYLVINESAKKQNVQITHSATKTTISLRLEPEQPQLFFIDKKTGKILAKSD